MSRYYQPVGDRLTGYLVQVTQCDQCDHKESERAHGYGHARWTTVDYGDGNEHHYCTACTDGDAEVIEMVRTYREEDEQK